MYYRQKVTGASGWEAVPNVEFWTELPGLVKDGARYAAKVAKHGFNAEPEYYIITTTYGAN